MEVKEVYLSLRIHENSKQESVRVFAERVADDPRSR